MIRVTAVVAAEAVVQRDILLGEELRWSDEWLRLKAGQFGWQGHLRRCTDQHSAGLVGVPEKCLATCELLWLVCLHQVLNCL